MNMAMPMPTHTQILSMAMYPCLYTRTRTHLRAHSFTHSHVPLYTHPHAHPLARLPDPLPHPKAYMHLSVAHASIQVLPIWEAVFDTGPFILVQALIFGAFVHAYNVIGAAGDDPSDMYSHILLTFRLGLMGDFNIHELDGEEMHTNANDAKTSGDHDNAQEKKSDADSRMMHAIVHVWFYLMCFIVSILMMVHMLYTSTNTHMSMQMSLHISMHVYKRA